MNPIKGLVGVIVATLAAVALATSTVATAQSPNWPTKPLRIVVPFAAGSGADADSRFYGDLLTKRLGQPVIVENRPGGSGLVMVQAVKAAPADGHTIMLASNTPMSVNPAVMREMAYDPFKDFKPLIGSSFGPAAFVIKGDSPHRTMKDLVAAAKREKRPISVGNYSLGYQLIAAWLGTATGVEINHINYKGGSQMVTDVIGGQLEVGIVDPSSFVDMHKGGRILMLNVTGAKRVDTVPEVQTMMESGYTDFETYIWNSFFVRSETPKETTDALIKHFAEVVALPESVAYRKQRGSTLLDLQGEDMRKFQVREYERFKRVAEAAGLVQ